MSRDIERKREFLIALYPGPKWRNRVLRMSDDQVVAIYLRQQKPQTEKKKKERTNGGGDTLF